MRQCLLSFGSPNATLLTQSSSISPSSISADDTIPKSTSTLLEPIALPEYKFHPPSSFVYPITNGRKCNSTHFTDYSWLHYVVDTDKVVCYTCLEAYTKSLVSFDSVRKECFLVGFNAWKRATESYKIHQKSELHRQSSLALINAKCTPVSSYLSAAVEKEQKAARIAYIEVISLLKVHALQGLALRGHHEQDGNLCAFLEERARNVPELRNFLQKRNNFLSHDMQNELIQIMAHIVQKSIVDDLQKSDFLSVIADGTTDISGTEQFSICIRCVDSMLVPQEYFLGLYEPPDSKGCTLASVLKDVFIRLQLDWNKLRGQCYDGAANMSGQIRGCQAIISGSQPLALFVHCTNHALDLALSEEAKQVQLVSDVMNCVREIAVCINSSSKRNKIFADCIQDGDCSSSTSRLLSICPTRWTVRGNAFSRFLQTYDAVVSTVEVICSDSSAAPDTKSKLRGYIRFLHKFETIFAMYMCDWIFRPCEKLAKVLQTKTMTCMEALSGGKHLLDTMSSLRTEEKFDQLYSDVEQFISCLKTEIKPPTQSSRVKVPPKRLEACNNASAPAVLDDRAILRKQFFAALDIICSEIDRRFSQSGLLRLSQMERVLLSPKSISDAAELEQHLGQHSGDFDLHALLNQLRNLPTLYCTTKKPTTVAELNEVFREQTEVVRAMLDQCVRLCSFISTIPASVATAERSFSALRRMKTYLRSTMSQSRLSNLMVLHVNKERTKQLDPNIIINEFISRNPRDRKSCFG